MLPTRNVGQRAKRDAIQSITKVPSVPVRCISVEHPSKTYLAGRSLTVTHNSSFATLLAVAVASGRWNCGRWDPITSAWMTLLISYEDGRRRVQRRGKQYLAGLQDPLNPPASPTHLLIYAANKAPRISLNTPEGVSKLNGLVKKNGIKFLVLDTLSHLSTADENSKTEMQPVMNALKDLARNHHCAVLVLHHTGKPGKDPEQRSVVYRSRGSSSIAAAADVIIDWGDRKGTNVTPVTVISKDDDGDRFNVEYIPEGEDGGIVRWKLVDVEVESESDKYGNAKKIIEALSKMIVNNPIGVTRGQLISETQLSKNTVISQLASLEHTIQSRQIDGPRGKVWVYAPVTYTWK